jgi:hypothetical protein
MTCEIVCQRCLAVSHATFDQNLSHPRCCPHTHSCTDLLASTHPEHVLSKCEHSCLTTPGSRRWQAHDAHEPSDRHRSASLGTADRLDPTDPPDAPYPYGLRLLDIPPFHDQTAHRPTASVIDMCQCRRHDALHQLRKCCLCAQSSSRAPASASFHASFHASALCSCDQLQ